MPKKQEDQEDPYRKIYGSEVRQVMMLMGWGWVCVCVCVYLASSCPEFVQLGLRCFVFLRSMVSYALLRLVSPVILCLGYVCV